MNLDWLYGRRSYRMTTVFPMGGEEYGAQIVQPRRIDMDDVIDIRNELERQLQEDKFVYEINYLLRSIDDTVNHTIDEEELDNLTRTDRGRLQVVARSGTKTATVDLREGIQPSVLITDLQGAELPTEQVLVANRLLESGRPIIQWRRIRYLLTYIPTVLLIATWIWLEATTRFPLPLHLWGWTIIVLAGVGTTLAARVIRRWDANKNTGVRITSVRRRATFDRQADEKTRTKTAVITALISIPATVAVTWILVALNLRS